MHDFLDRFKGFYEDFQTERLSELSLLYCERAVFIDPISKLTGVEQILGHFEHVCKGLDHCRFHFVSTACDEENLVFEWEMHYSHPKMAGGKSLTLPGVSLLKLKEEDGVKKISYHRDYYDMGLMVYEHVPLLGRVLKYLKTRLAVQNSHVQQNSSPNIVKSYGN